MTRSYSGINLSIMTIIIINHLFNRFMFTLVVHNTNNIKKYQ